jgi:hypothetical protein
MRSVIAEGYADGSFETGADWVHGFLSTGSELKHGSITSSELKEYSPVTLATGNGYSDTQHYYRKAAELMGTAYVDVANKPGYWGITFFAPLSGSFTFFSAPAWEYIYAPEGNVSGKPQILVVYGLDGMPDDVKSAQEYYTARAQDAFYSPNAGYKVYHITKM